MKTTTVKSFASEWFVVESFRAHHSQKTVINCEEKNKGLFVIIWKDK